MAIALSEVLVFLLPLIVVVVVLYRRRRRERKTIENVVLSIIRSKNGATLDEIIVGAHISVDEASSIIRKFIAHGVIEVEERDGKTICKVA